MSFLLRVVLPDRPGALGAVATALGEAGADILSVDIVERSAGTATDDLVVELPPGKLADSLVSAAAGVEGTRVESIRPYAGTMDPHRELELLDRLAATPDSSLPVLADGVTRVFRAGWSLVLAAPAAGRAAVLASGGAAPEVDALDVPWWPPAPSRVLAADESWVPPEVGRLDTELAVTPLGAGALLVGRPALHWLPAELVRLQHLAAIAATVTSAESGAW